MAFFKASTESIMQTLQGPGLSRCHSMVTTLSSACRADPTRVHHVYLGLSAC